ncbi:hypothetical protein [Nostoc sp.]|uniref:hypothetical protein n=1 Tax=Nostoc sp. TaxID=1180 RepID=UPI002FFABD58
MLKVLGKSPPIVERLLLQIKFALRSRSLCITLMPQPVDYTNIPMIFFELKVN